MYWIVSYDIPDNKRRTKISKILEGFGKRAQYSVFECEIDSEKCDKLAALIAREIDPQEDDVRFYPLNRADIKRVRVMGRAQLYRSAPYHIIRKPDPDTPPDDPQHPF